MRTPPSSALADTPAIATGTDEQEETARPNNLRSPHEALLDLALAYLPSRALHVVATLGIADLLADGPREVEEVAAEARVHAQSLGRVLRTLAMYGMFVQAADGRYALTSTGELLRTGVLRAGVQFCGDVVGDGSWWSTVGRLHDAVAPGAPSFEQAHGSRFFDYVANKPECARWFDRGMTIVASTENPAIAAAYDFSGCDHIVDVGGGQGGLLAEILKRWSDSNGTLFDLPHVIAEPAALVDVDLSRWRAAGGDFFESVPAGGDVYVLKRILHDWDDEHSLSILRSCRTAMRDDARLLVVDAVLPSGNDPHPGKVMDLLMMAVGTGRERTGSELTDLLDRAGLRVSRILPTPTALSITEATPVP